MDSPCSAELHAAARPQPATGYSFSAASGPLPAEVRAAVAEACMPPNGGRSILSLPFTSDTYRTLQDETEACLRRLLDIPDGFRVLFLQGGATLQFAMLPLNLLGGARLAAYVDTGHWSRRAIEEAGRYADPDIVARAVGHIPHEHDWQLDPRAAYCHITTNETADGLQFDRLPALPVPLVADMSSDLLTRPLDFTRLALGYAATQKTIGVPGLTVLLLRADLLGRAHPATPRAMNYTAQAEAASRVNTPPVFPVLVAHRMLHWIERQGGVTAMAAAVERRSAAVYAVLDDSGGFYRNTIARAHRSRANPCFHLADQGLTERFLDAAQRAGLHDLRGHPRTGGIRVSLYNGVEDEAVAALAGFMREFARTQG